MQRDETMCVLDVGMKKGGVESKAAARCGVRESGAGSFCCGRVSIFAPSSNPGP